MSRYERRIFFDRLVELRDRYPIRGGDDRGSILSLTAVDAFVEASWAAAEAEAIAEYLADQATSASPSEPAA